MSVALRRCQRGYESRDGRWIIEHDIGSVGEWDDQSEPSWFIYSADQDPAIVGPPDAFYEGLTLRACREWIAAQLAEAAS